MAGTSTGGLISIMLGRLRMNIDDCIFDYETLGGKVFGHPRWFHLRSILWLPRDKYNHRVLNDVVMDVVRRRAPKIDSFPGGQNFSFDENRCRTVVVSYQEPKDGKGLEQPYLFRTYKNLRLDDEPAAPGDRPLIRNPGEAQDILMWQVARATSAAPGYFKPVKIDGLRYLDGGFGANNPCGEIVEEVRNLNNQATKCVSTVVSIGTGKNKDSSRLKITGPTRFINFLNVARQWASDSEREHTVQRHNSRSPGSRYDYFRLNVEDGLGAMKLDEWRCRGRIRTTLGKAIGKLRSSRKAQKSKINEKPKENGKQVGGQRRAGTAIHMKNLGQSLHDSGTESVANGVLLENESMQDRNNAENTQSQNGKGPQTQSNIPEWFHPKKKTLETIRKHTHAYLERADVQEQIKEIARILVKGRRDRARSDPQRWEKACFGAWYQCKLQGCPRGEKEYALRDKMAHHLLDKHEDTFSREDQRKLNRALDDCKIVVL
ncbi:hypothetical protein MMC28_000462 [Mycoblastus sanguinarius]|nr:hypothetical protein [Mycoblastus sanguinarius]